MVDQYNLRVFNQGIPPEEMHAVCAELEGKEGELRGQKFDVIVVSHLPLEPTIVIEKPRFLFLPVCIRISPRFIYRAGHQNHRALFEAGRMSYRG